MSGKKPKERERYVLRTGDGSLVEVTREVYLEWYQSKRQERYQTEKQWKYGVCSLDKLKETGKAIGYVSSGLEENIIKELCVKKLHEGLGRIREQDAFLIRLLFFEEVSVKDAAWICGCSCRTIQNRRKRILEELRRIMERFGITGCYF